MAAQAPDDLEAFFNGCTEMPGTYNGVTLVEVIGANPYFKQLMHQFFHHLNVIVHVFQQHGLASKGNPGIGKLFACFFHLRRNFVGMGEVDAHIQRMIFLQHVDQGAGDALRQNSWHFGADADDLDMGNAPQPRKQVFHMQLGHGKGVSSGNQDIADLGMLLDVIKAGLPRFNPDVAFIFCHHARTRTVPAIGGAEAGNQEQNPVGIAVHQPRHGHGSILAARVGHFLRRNQRFLDPRNDLPPDRAIGIVGIDEIEELGRDAHAQLCPGEQHPRAFLRREAEVGFQGLEIGDPIAQLPAPIIPLLWSGPRPMAWVGRCKMELGQLNSLPVELTG